MKIALLTVNGDAFGNGLSGGASSGTFDKAAKHVDSLMGFKLTDDGIRSVGKLVMYLNWFFILVVIAGAIWLAFSGVGNSGKARKAGIGIVAGGVASLLILHIGILLAISYKSFSRAHSVALLVTFTSQILFFVAPPVLYLLGIDFYSLFEMTGQPMLERRSNSNFRTLKWIMGAGVVLLVLAQFM